MVLPVVFVLATLVVLVLVAVQPHVVARRRDRFTTEQLTENLRTLPNVSNPALLLSLALQAAATGVVGVVLGRSAGPVWLLLAVTLVGLAAVQRRTLPLTLRVMREAGARPDDPGSEGARHGRRQRRWYSTGLWTLAVGRSLDLLSDLDHLAAARLPGVVLTLLGMLVLAVAVWRTLRGLAAPRDA